MTPEASPVLLLLAPALAIIAAWWASTAALLVLVGRSPRTRRTTLAALSVAALAALAGAWALRGDESVAGAYGGVAMGLVIWAWHEVAFLGGFVTGPRRSACPAGVGGWRRFQLGAAALAHHEAALAATLALLWAATADAPNTAALCTFALLFAMRLSAKLNLFLGVAHVGEDLLPAHLRYLASYFRRAPMNPLMPLSLLAGGLTAALLLNMAATAPTPGATVQAMLLSVLAALAVFEHALMIAPAGPGGGGWDHALWRWALKLRDGSGREEPAAGGDDPSRPSARPGARLRQIWRGAPARANRAGKSLGSARC